MDAPTRTRSRAGPEGKWFSGAAPGIGKIDAMLRKALGLKDVSIPRQKRHATRFAAGAAAKSWARALQGIGRAFSS